MNNEVSFSGFGSGVVAAAAGAAAAGGAGAVAGVGAAAGLETGVVSIAAGVGFWALSPEIPDTNIMVSMVNLIIRDVFIFRNF